MFEKTRKISVKKIAFLLHLISAVLIGKTYCGFLKNKSRKVRVDQDDIKFAFCIKNWFFGFIISLNW